MPKVRYGIHVYYVPPVCRVGQLTLVGAASRDEKDKKDDVGQTRRERTKSTHDKADTTPSSSHVEAEEGPKTEETRARNDTGGVFSFREGGVERGGGTLKPPSEQRPSKPDHYPHSSGMPSAVQIVDDDMSPDMRST